MFDIKQLPAQSLIYCQLHPYEQTVVKQNTVISINKLHLGSEKNVYETNLFIGNLLKNIKRLYFKISPNNNGFKYYSQLYLFYDARVYDMDAELENQNVSSTHPIQRNIFQQWFLIFYQHNGMGYFVTQQLPAQSPIFCQLYPYVQTPVKWNTMISIQEIISPKVARKKSGHFVSASMR